MSWWSRSADAPPFDVYVSIGLPSGGSPSEPSRRPSARNAGPPDRNHDFDDLPPHDETLVQWTTAILSVTRTILGRGGRIVSGFHPDVSPLLWAVALEHAVERVAEAPEGELTPVVLLGETSSIPESDEASILLEYDRSRAVSVESGGPRIGGRYSLRRLDTDRPRYGLAVWPDESCDADLEAFGDEDQVAVIAAPALEIRSAWSDRVDAGMRRMIGADRPGAERDAGFPYAFTTNRILDEWLG